MLSVINITSDIKLVSNSSTIKMMHGPINIRLKNIAIHTVSNEMQTVFIIFRPITDICVLSDKRAADVGHRIGI